MTNQNEEYPLLMPQGEVMVDADLPSVLAELGESGDKAVQLVERPAHLPMRTWVKIQCVLEIQEYLLAHGTTDISRACRDTGWEMWTYRRAVRDPAVIEYIEHCTFEIFELKARAMAEKWSDVVDSQVAIACNTEQGQAATRAATWIAEQLRIHDERRHSIVREAELQGGSNRLAGIAARFGAELTERVTTTRSVKLPPGDS